MSVDQKNTKTVDQIAKDREAVARMVGAKDSMEAAIRRVAILEGTLRDVRERAAVLGKALGPSVYIGAYRHPEGRNVPTPASTLSAELDAVIAKVL